MNIHAISNRNEEYLLSKYGKTKADFYKQIKTGISMFDCDEMIFDGERHNVKDLIRVGLKFTSQTFAAKGEIIRVGDTIDVRLTETQGTSYIEKDWNKAQFIAMIKNGNYIPQLKPEERGPVVW